MNKSITKYIIPLVISFIAHYSFVTILVLSFISDDGGNTFFGKGLTPWVLGATVCAYLLYVAVFITTVSKRCETTKLIAGVLIIVPYLLSGILNSILNVVMFFVYGVILPLLAN